MYMVWVGLYKDSVHMYATDDKATVTMMVV